MSWVLAHEKELITIGKPLRPWTVNRMEEMENCFQLKLAGVHTDFPEKQNLLVKRRRRNIIGESISYCRTHCGGKTALSIALAKI